MPGNYLPADYFPIPFFILVAGAFGVSPAGRYRETIALTGSRKALRERCAAFSDRVPFPLRYYIIAMLFVIFDIEVIYLYPWAVSFHQIGLFGLVEMILFIMILLVGYFYAWQKGALEWD